jgi:hypothetical protein
MKENKPIEAMFKNLSIYSYFLANSSKEHYAFIGKFQNDTMLNVQVNKQLNGRYVNMTIACVLAAKKIKEQINKERIHHTERLDLNSVSEDRELKEQVRVSSFDEPSEKETPIIASEVLTEDAPTSSAQNIPPDMMQQFNMSRSNLTFKDLPFDLQKIIERDFEKMANNPDPS